MKRVGIPGPTPRCRHTRSGQRRSTACSLFSRSCSSWIWAMQSPASRSCSSGPNFCAAIRRAASGGQPPGALPKCYRDAASQSLCHSSPWSQTLLVSHDHHGADFASGKNMRKIHTIWYVIIPCPKIVCHHTIKLSFHTKSISFHTPWYVIIPTIVISYHTGMSSYPHMSFHTIKVSIHTST